MAGYATSDTSNPWQLSASESSVKRGDAAAAEAKKIAPREPCQICLGMAGEQGLFHLRKYRKKDYEFFLPFSAQNA